MENLIKDLSRHMLTKEIIRKSNLPRGNSQRIMIEYPLNKSIKTTFIKENNKIEEHIKEEQQVKEDDIKKKEFISFQPKMKDSLFWCLYIACYGEVAYELIDNKNIIAEKKIKYEFIDKVRKNKDLLKKYKFATLSHIENQLANENKIDLKTLLSLSVIENMNILYLKNKICYQHLMNDTEDLHVFRHLENNSFCYFKSTIDDMKETVNGLYIMDNIEKPLKSISSYKVEDLVKISNKLGINIMLDNSKKIKTKNELYESIVLYL
jgi:hypothetical protein